MMNHIKDTKELFLHILNSAQEGLKLLREKCPHENTFEGVYEWRVGATYRAIICDDCGEVVKNLDFEINPTAPQKEDK